MFMRNKNFSETKVFYRKIVKIKIIKKFGTLKNIFLGKL